MTAKQKEQIELDCIGMRCPRPIIEIAKMARKSPGAILQVKANDLAFESDVNAWVENSKATILSLESEGQERLVLDLQMYVGAKEPHDSLKILGNPPLSVYIDGGIFGDTATVSALVNTIPKIISTQSGLRTMMELPLPYAFMGIKS